jgi:hypothetical protein
VNVIVGFATGFSMPAYGLRVGATWWADLLSADLLATFLSQTAPLHFARRPLPIPFSATGLLLLASFSRDLNHAYRPAEMATAVLSCLAPVWLNRVGPTVASRHSYLS